MNREIWTIPTVRDVEASKCRLEYQWNEPFVYIPPRNSERKKFCMCIATYGGKHNGELKDFSFFSIVLKSFLETTNAKRFDWVFYIGFQADPYFESRRSDFENLLYEITKQNDREDIKLETLYYTLNKGLIDITYKYNRIIDQAYKDQCKEKKNLVLKKKMI